MKRSICLVVVFLLAQFFSAFFMTFCVNIPHLLNKGELDLNALVNSPTALAFSMILSAVLSVGTMWIFNGWMAEAFVISVWQRLFMPEVCFLWCRPFLLSMS